MSAYILICLLLAFGYAALILIYFVGWMLIPHFKTRQSKELVQTETFTILVPARNEETQIKACIDSLVSQDFTVGAFEIIIINDHSTDGTESVVRQCMALYKEHKIVLLNAASEGFSGKKEGIALGVERASFPNIVLTDADCTRGKYWLNTLAQFRKEKQAQMVYAPVFFTANTMFERFQSLEFAGLVGIGGAAIQLKNPNMCSAANLVFTKQAFVEVGGYADNKHLASGDDEFLLHKIFKRYPQQVHFLKNVDAIVYTSPNASVEQLTQQRRRWVSKSTKYENRYITAILVGAYFFNLSLLLNAILAFFIPSFTHLFVQQIAIKMAAEALLLGVILRFFKRSDLLLLVPLVQLFHILYVIIIGVWANVQTYTWKERELK